MTRVCPKCGGKEYQLLNRWVCDNCEPPKGASPPAQSPTKTLADKGLDDLTKSLQGHAWPRAVAGAPMIPGPGSWPVQNSSPAAGQGINLSPSKALTQLTTSEWLGFWNAADSYFQAPAHFSTQWLRNFLQHPQGPGNPWCYAVVAGGFIRDTLRGVTPKDLDVFFSNATAQIQACRELERAFNVTSVATTNVATTYQLGKGRLQLIHHKPFQKPGELLAEFDFTVNGAALWWHPADGWQSHLVPSFRLDVQARRLRPLNSTRMSLTRILDFIQNKGYRYSDLDLGELHTNLLGRGLSIKAANSFIYGGY